MPHAFRQNRERGICERIHASERYEAISSNVVVIFGSFLINQK